MPAPNTPHRTSPAVYRRRRIVAGLLSISVLGLLLWGIGFVVVSAVRPLPAAAVELIPAASAAEVANIDFPDGARSAIGASGFDGVIAHSGDQGQAPIASITKVITALVVLHAKPIADGTDGPTITFTAADVEIRAEVIAANGSNAPVTDGLQLSERQTLTTMLLPSANNYALSLAQWAFGSVQAFDTAASTWLSENHLDETHIVEPSGLSAQNVSNPENLVRLGQLAEADPVVASIVALPSADIPGVGLLKNTNTLLGTAGVVGIKTGTTDEAGSCLLYAAHVPVGSQTVTLVGVELGGASHDAVDNDVLAVIESASAAFRQVDVATNTGSLANVSTLWGQSTQLVATNAATLIAFGDIPISTAPEIPAFSTAPSGKTVGEVVFSTGTQSVRVPVATNSALTDPGLFWRVGHSSELG